MNENDPHDEDDLKPRLAEWRAPQAPARLDERIFEMHRRGRWKTSGWRGLITGTVRVPIPVVAAACLLLVLATIAALRPARLSPTSVPAEVSAPAPVPQEDSTTPAAAADARFAPAKEMKVTILYPGESR
jgi:hypothetical protein